jgi:hypothetical protein
MSSGEAEEEEAIAPIPGFLYGYLERLEAHLPEDNEVVIQVNFRKDVRDIQTTRENTTFGIDRRIRFAFNVKFERPGVMRSKTLLLKLFRIVAEGQRRLFADLRLDLKDFFRPPEMAIQTLETRAKMTPKPVLTCAFAVYFKSDPRPSPLGTFEKSTIEGGERPIQADSHVRLLVEDAPPAEAESEDFDAAILEQFLVLSVPSSEFPAIEELIVRHWYATGKSKPGYPGFLLARELRALRSGSLRKALSCVEARLKDLRSTIHDSETAIEHFSACLCLAQRLRELDEASQVVTAICRASISTVTELIAPELQRIFVKSFRLSPSSPEFRAQVADFGRVLGRLKSPSSDFLCRCIIDELDCLLANSPVTQSSLNSLTLVLAANTAASKFATACRIAFPRFTQVLLCVIAHNEILDNPRSVFDLAPLVPPTFAYFMLCHIRPDQHLPEALDYQKIERFATELNINLNRNLSADIVFKPEIPEIPAECPDFVFH